MFKQLLNEVRVQLSFLPQGPILIKSGTGVAAGSDMAFVKTYRNGREEVYLPGSSLKGVIRSHAERIGRTLNEQAVCNPFNSFYTNPQRNQSPHGVPSCSDAFRSVERQKGMLSSYDAFRGSCPACKLFGSLSLAGRFNIGDAYVDEKEEAPKAEYRDGVGIDRFSGGAVNHAKFDFEVITQGEFFSTITIQNFELWQLSLLSYVLRDFEEGMITIGMGSSRGLGRIKAKIESIQLDTISRNKPDTLQGIGTLYRGDDKSKYDFTAEEPLKLPDYLQFSRQGIRQTAKVEAKNLHNFYEVLQDYFPDYIDQFEAMQVWRKQMGLKVKGF